METVGDSNEKSGDKKGHRGLRVKDGLRFDCFNCGEWIRVGSCFWSIDGVYSSVYFGTFKTKVDFLGSILTC